MNRRIDKNAHSRRSLAATLAALVVVAVIVASPAFAATKPKSGAAPAQGAQAATTSATVQPGAPVKASAGGPTDVQVWPGQDGQTVVIVVVELNSTTKLPATVRVPIMPGTAVQWVGEVLGGDGNADIERPYKLVNGIGGQFAELTLTTARRGQVDAIGYPMAVTGDTASVAVNWVQTVSSPITAISVRTPANVSDVKISPKPQGAPVTNEVGEALYILPPKNYAPGEKLPITVSYSTKVATPAAPGSEATPVLIGLGIALVVAVGILIFVLTRQRAGSA